MKRLPTVEGLGCVNEICNQMTVTNFVTGGGDRHERIFCCKI